MNTVRFFQFSYRTFLVALGVFAIAACSTEKKVSDADLIRDAQEKRIEQQRQVLERQTKERDELEQQEVYIKKADQYTK